MENQRQLNAENPKDAIEIIAILVENSEMKFTRKDNRMFDIALQTLFNFVSESEKMKIVK